MTIGELRGGRWDSGLEYTTGLMGTRRLLPGVQVVEAMFVSQSNVFQALDGIERDFEIACDLRKALLILGKALLIFDKELLILGKDLLILGKELLILGKELLVLALAYAEKLHRFGEGLVPFREGFDPFVDGHEFRIPVLLGYPKCAIIDPWATIRLPERS
jgi:hypothetical protein